MLELALPAFVAGLLTFLAPCTLPLVPGYLGFISGASLQDLKDPNTAPQARHNIVKNGLSFVLGFSLVFIVLGVLAGAAGQFLAHHRLLLSRIGGIFVILFGLFMMNLVKLPGLSQDKKIPIPKFFKPGRPSNSFILGLTFGFGWTPCVGPILASILLVASTTGTIAQGAALLSIFSLGLALPFVLIAFGIGRALEKIQKITRFLNAISIIGGVFLIILGTLMITNQLGYWTSLFYKLFGFINYQSLLDYL